MITVLSTSTQANGAFVTFTHLVANPGTVDASQKPSGFLENHGQVAGVFTVVGIFASALVVALVWFIKRHRRRQRRKAWFTSLRQYPPSPFADSYREPHEANYMRSVQSTSDAIHEPHTVNYHDAGYRPRSQPDSTDGSTGLGLTGVGTLAGGTTVPLRRPLSGGDPFGDPPHVPRNTPVSISPRHDRFTEPSGASIAPSSPSIYPESLPPTDDSPSPVDSEPRTQLRSFPEPLLRRSLSTPGHAGAPPRPPRSHLRDSHKLTDILPLTPPSSHGHSKSSNPEVNYAGLPKPFTPTWRNARPHTAPETSTSQGSREVFGER
ncbi:hypothetical protein AN958_05062 [Leucoagaricus sp. SymC.cos]|nr:hypothetical protein AN958_05062 [Leucoagaricus sp. SymC.cos]